MSRRKNTQQKKTVNILTAYSAEIEEHRRKLKKRGFPLATENMPPVGQAAGWYAEVIHHVPRCGMHVAKQIARLAGEGCEVTIPWRSLADAVGIRNRAGNLRSYTERGVEWLVESGWLTVKTTGQKRGAKTTFCLEVGDFTDWTYMEDDDCFEE
jgi:hypothetical protein